MMEPPTNRHHQHVRDWMELPQSIHLIRKLRVQLLQMALCSRQSGKCTVPNDAHTVCSSSRGLTICFDIQRCPVIEHNTIKTAVMIDAFSQLLEFDWRFLIPRDDLQQACIRMPSETVERVTVREMRCAVRNKYS